MRHIDGISAVPQGPGRAIAIGIFDGVHLGHRQLLSVVKRLAAADGLHSSLLTFEPHPAKVLAPELAPRMVETLDERIARVGAENIDEIVIHPFDRSFAATEAEDFVRDILVGQLNAKHVVVGSNFTFGRAQRGTVQRLEELGATCGFQVHPQELVRVEGIPVSSTKVREFVRNGNMKGVALLLGRPYTVTGKVEHGEGRGKGLGFATANIPFLRELWPTTGVYAGTVHGPWPARVAITNIGNAPTFGGGVPRIEIHILDYDGPDIYGETITFEAHEYLRPEKQFESGQALVAQIGRDIEAARAAFASRRAGTP